MNLLERINSPKDLRELSLEELGILRDELKRFILESVAKTGGHLASNLGAVELTLALHYMLNTPEDKIIWDVSHQAYCHKIITGRRESFGTLRQFKGISGFCKRSESVFDVFGAGHACTALSAAVGVSAAENMKNSGNKTVAIIGDGSLTGGMTYEAMNNIEAAGKNLIVILNDNEMSISKNVGAMSEYLSRVTSSPIYNRVRHDVEGLLKRLPSIGPTLFKSALKLEESLKNLLVPGIVFEEFGFRYFGPIDGHDLESLTATLKNISNIEEPVLIHVVTRKGDSYEYAEQYPTAYHGVSAFDITTGKAHAKSAHPSYTKVFGQTMLELAEKNNRICAVTAAMAPGTGLVEFSEKFADRFYDVGIAEEHAVTFAAGMATQGFVPVVAIYSTFMQRAYDQVMHDIALQKLHVVVCMDRAGLVGADGPTHHGVFDISFLRHLPNVVLLCPKDGREFRSMLAWATTPGHKKAICIRYPRGEIMSADMPQGFEPFDPAKLDVENPGSDVMFVATGVMVQTAEKVCKELGQKGIKAGFINARVLKPFVEQSAGALEGAKLVVTLEEHSIIGGLGSLMLEFCNDRDINTPVMRIGLPDSYIEHGSVEELRKLHGLDVASITGKVAERLGR